MDSSRIINLLRKIKESEADKKRKEQVVSVIEHIAKNGYLPGEISATEIHRKFGLDSQIELYDQAQEFMGLVTFDLEMRTGNFIIRYTPEEEATTSPERIFYTAVFTNYSRKQETIPKSLVEAITNRDARSASLRKQEKSEETPDEWPEDLPDD